MHPRPSSAANSCCKPGLLLGRFQGFFRAVEESFWGPGAFCLAEGNERINVTTARTRVSEGIDGKDAVGLYLEGIAKTPLLRMLKAMISTTS